jgi:hypothetical protein
LLRSDSSQNGGTTLHTFLLSAENDSMKYNGFGFSGNSEANVIILFLKKGKYLLQMCSRKKW